MTRTPRRSGRAHAEPLRTLDEKFVSNAIAFEAARPVATMVVDSTPFRREDGSLDRELILTAWERFIVASPAQRQRLVRAPLGLFTPSWVFADSVEVRDHVRFHPGVVEWDPRRTELLTGLFNGPMDPKGPLWDILVVELSTGQLAFPMRIQHVMGDGMFGLMLFTTFTEENPYDVAPSGGRPLRFPDDPPAPRGPLGLALAARRTIASSYDSFAEEWADWKRKPLKKRLRRVGGRLIRSPRDVWIRRSGLVERTVKPKDAAIITVPVQAAKKAARGAGGTLSDLTVALGLHAFAAMHPERTEIATLVPISPQRDRTAEKRNHITMARVSIPAGLGLPESIASVHEQIQHASETGESGITRGVRDWQGYASYLPVFLRPRYFGHALVEAFTLWPTTEPEDEAALFSSSYLKRLDFAVQVRADHDSRAFVDSVVRSLRELGVPPVDWPDQAPAGVLPSASGAASSPTPSSENGTTR
jgi:diacylglycerol O-acyltransferase